MYSFTGCYDQNTVFSVRTGPCVMALERHQNNSHNFQNCVCLDYLGPIISDLKMCKTLIVLSANV